MIQCFQPRAGRLYPILFVAAALWLSLFPRSLFARTVAQTQVPVAVPVHTGAPFQITVSPSSTLLPPNTTSLNLAINTSQATACRYAVNEARAFEAMAALHDVASATQQAGTVVGLDPDPNTVNHVYVRCEADPNQVLELQYRSLAAVNPPYPRTGNLWGTYNFTDQDLTRAAKIDLWLGAEFNAEQIRQLRQINPHSRILTSISAIEAPDGLPEHYYIHDAGGKRIQLWPGLYRLNLTKIEVADYVAQQGYQKVIAEELMFDGIFLDNVFLSFPCREGNPLGCDADGDGTADDADALDQSWRAGILHELTTLRNLLPNALMVSHEIDIFDPAVPQIFNGTSIAFDTVDIIEGRKDFNFLKEKLDGWHRRPRQPYVTMTESAPPAELSYGYGYSPFKNIPPATLEFARTYYPYMRLGLATTLMQDGYFAHEFGDMWHGNDWYYDELDFDLGYPLGEAQYVQAAAHPIENQVENGGFESGIDGNWQVWLDKSSGAVATTAVDSSSAAEGANAARVDITTAASATDNIQFAQYNFAVTAGTNYFIKFWAKSTAPRVMTISAQKATANWDNYGIWRNVNLTTEWQEYSLAFKANATGDDSRLQFLVGGPIGSVWLDNVRFYAGPPDILQRAYTKGLVLLNATHQPQTIQVGPGYRRFVGNEAPKYEYILDDSEAIFSASAGWSRVDLDSGIWQGSAPFYHDWGKGVMKGSADNAQWQLNILAADTYTISAWWPAAPEAGSWSSSVTYQIVAGDQILATQTFDQRQGGDSWHPIGTVALTPEQQPTVRLICAGGAACVADALYVTSRSRYNDGAIVESVTLQPMDGVLLARIDGEIQMNDRAFLPMIEATQ